MSVKNTLEFAAKNRSLYTMAGLVGKLHERGQAGGNNSSENARISMDDKKVPKENEYDEVKHGVDLAPDLLFFITHV